MICTVFVRRDKSDKKLFEKDAIWLCQNLS